jgi:hypothetical protein
MPLDVEGIGKTLLANRVKSSDELFLEDLRIRTERGEDVTTLGMLRQLISMSGRNYTMKDIRAILRVPDLKPTPTDYLVRALIVGVCGWFLLMAVSDNSPDDKWALWIGLCAVIWVAFTLGKSAGARLYPNK